MNTAGRSTRPASRPRRWTPGGTPIRRDFNRSRPPGGQPARRNAHQARFQSLSPARVRIELCSVHMNTAGRSTRSAPRPRRWTPGGTPIRRDFNRSRPPGGQPARQNAHQARFQSLSPARARIELCSVHMNTGGRSTRPAERPSGAISIGCNRPYLPGRISQQKAILGTVFWFRWHKYHGNREKIGRNGAIAHVSLAEDRFFMRFADSIRVN